MPVGWKYGIGTAAYRKKQNRIHIILFLASFAIFTCTGLLYIFKGIAKTYQSLQGSPDCSTSCSAYLNSPWFPIFASFPLRPFQQQNLSGFQLQRDSRYTYFLCRSITMRQQTATYKMIMPRKIRSIAQQYYRLTRIDFGESYSQPMRVGYSGPGVVYERHSFPRSTEKGVFDIYSSTAAGVSVMFEQLQNAQNITIQPQQYNDCDVYDKPMNISGYTFIAAQLRRTKEGIPVEPLAFNFVRTINYYSYVDWVYWVVIAVSGAIVVETIVYYFACAVRHQRKAFRRDNAWVKYVRFMQDQE